MSSYNYPLNNFTIVLIGRFPGHTESELATALQSLGAVVYPEITTQNWRNVSYVVYNPEQTNVVPEQLALAQHLNLRIIPFSTLQNVLSAINQSNTGGTRLSIPVINNLFANPPTITATPSIPSNSRTQQRPLISTSRPSVNNNTNNVASQCLKDTNKLLDRILSLFRAWLTSGQTHRQQYQQLVLQEGQLVENYLNQQRTQAEQQAGAVLSQDCLPALVTLEKLHPVLIQMFQQGANANPRYVSDSVQQGLAILKQDGSGNASAATVVVPNKAAKVKKQVVINEEKNQYWSPVEEEKKVNELTEQKSKRTTTTTMNSTVQQSQLCRQSFQEATRQARSMLSLALLVTQTQNPLLADELAHDTPGAIEETTEWLNRNFSCPLEVAFAKKIIANLNRIMPYIFENTSTGETFFDIDTENFAQDRLLSNSISSLLATLTQAGIGEEPPQSTDCATAFKRATINARFMLQVTLQFMKNRDPILADTIASGVQQAFTEATDFVRGTSLCPLEISLATKIVQALSDILQYVAQNQQHRVFITNSAGLASNIALRNQIVATLSEVDESIVNAQSANGQDNIDIDNVTDAFDEIALQQELNDQANRRAGMLSGISSAIRNTFNSIF